MSCKPSLTERVRGGWGVALLLACSAAALSACDDDGKTLPSKCPELPLYDIQNGGEPSFDDPGNCVTDIGHAVNQSPSTAGTSAGGTSTAGTSTGGTSTGTAGEPAASAGAGGA